MNDGATCKVCHRPTGDTAWLCTEDTDKLETWIAELPALLADVATTAARQDRLSPSSSPRRRAVEVDPDPETEPHTKDRPDLGVKVQTLPVHIDAAKVAATIIGELGTWVRDLAESRGAEHTIPTPARAIGPRCTDGPGCYHPSCAAVRPLRPDAPKNPPVTALVAWMLRAMSSIRLDEACGELFRDARRWTAQANAMSSGQPDRVYVGQCRAAADDWCCARELWAEVGADEIVCDGWGTADGDGCFATHTAGQRHVMLRAEFSSAKVTWDEAIQAIPGLFPGDMPPSAYLRAKKSRGLAAATIEGSGVTPRPLVDDGGDLLTRHGEPLWHAGGILAEVERWRLLSRTGGVRPGRRARVA